MGRFETLNADTRDLINCLLPALAASYGVPEAVDIIPEDIRMRAWDCDRRDHIKDETENDPRNWGVQFLKDLMSISRILGGDLEKFRTDLYAKVALHEPKHPWCRLADIKQLKYEYEHPQRVKEVEEESAGTSSTDSYLEELHEPDMPRGKKRSRHDGEVYEAIVQPSHKARKYGRLRRGEDGSRYRKEVSTGRSRSHHSREPSTSIYEQVHGQRRKKAIVNSDQEYSEDDQIPADRPTSSTRAARNTESLIRDSVLSSNEPLAVQKLQAELEVAEAELKAARLKYLFIQAQEQAEAADPANADAMNAFN